MSTVIYPTDTIKKIEKIFLGGTIDQNLSIDWQIEIIHELEEFDVTIYNPRRKKWETGLEQNKSNEQFSHQVNWELICLEKSDLIIMNILPDSKSPISLLELGIFHKKMMVCCPSGFYRKGNVDIVCEKFNIPLYEDITEMISTIKEKLHNNIY